MICKACKEQGIEFERIDLSQHVRIQHQMSSYDYKNKYHCDVVDPLLKRERGLTRKTNEEKRPIECPFCEENGLKLRFTNKHLFERHCRNNDSKHSHLIFNEVNSNDWVECKIDDCGFRSSKISFHIEKVHKITTDEYKKKYGEIVSKKILKISKENGQKAALTVDERIYKHKCRIDGCENIIEGKDLICISCKLKDARIEQEKKFEGKQEFVDFVRCQCKLDNGEICNWPDVRLTKHIEHHGYTSARYKEEFNCRLITSTTLAKKTAFSGCHSEETKKQMRASSFGRLPWNAGLTKYEHPGIASISEKAIIRLSQLHNNNRFYNPVSGERNGNFGKKTWCSGLTKQNSELIENRDEINKNIFHHQSNFGQMEVYDLNKYIQQYAEEQIRRIKLVDTCCFECKSTTKLQVHHMNPRNCYSPFDISAHNYLNLIVLCEKCHASKGQRCDDAILNCYNDLEKFKTEYPIEFQIYSRWIKYTENRFVSSFPIDKTFLQKISIENRENLSLDIFEELRFTGFPYSNYSDIELLKDFENVKKSTIRIETGILKNYNTAGSILREHFIHAQYLKLNELFLDDQKLMKVVRNRLGLDWKNQPEFFTLSNKTIVKGFEVLFPKYRYSKYKASVAKWIIENFCKSDDVYDYAAGWGDRLIGTIAAGKNYYGVDTNTNLCLELNLLANWLKKHNSNKIEIENKSAINLNRKIQFAYSCPPYGNQEEYSGSEYENDKNWLEKYMNPVIKSCYDNLEKSGLFVCHLPLRLQTVVRNELNKFFKEKQSIEMANKFDAFHGGLERINEIILIYEK